MRTAFTFLAAMIASPAAAFTGVQIPEPSNLALFGLGLTGLIVGRQFAKRRKNTRDD